MFRRTVDEVSNLATHSRYFGREISPRKAVTAGSPRSAWTISSREPRGGDTKAMAAPQATAGRRETADPGQVTVYGSGLTTVNSTRMVVRAAAGVSSRK